MENDFVGHFRLISSRHDRQYHATPPPGTARTRSRFFSLPQTHFRTGPALLFAREFFMAHRLFAKRTQPKPQSRVWSFWKIIRLWIRPHVHSPVSALHTSKFFLFHHRGVLPASDRHPARARDEKLDRHGMRHFHLSANIANRGHFHFLKRASSFALISFISCRVSVRISLTSSFVA